jgi:dephospho-CoA kinase
MAGRWIPLKIGLTGSIGMGNWRYSLTWRYPFIPYRKELDHETISLSWFVSWPILTLDTSNLIYSPVFDSDEAVHRLYAKGGCAVQPIQDAFPTAIVDGAIDRAILGRIVLSDPPSLIRLEGIVHPLVAEERNHFLENGIQNNNFLVVYDIPLLMKDPNKHQVDYSIVVTASSQTQKKRVLSRPGMTEEKFQSILSKQVPDEIQRMHADYVIDTDYPGYSEARSQLAHVLLDIINKNDEKWKLWSSFPLTRIDQTAGYRLSEEVERKRLRDVFDLIIFDLDDTLLPVMGPVMDAHHAQMRFFSTVLNQTALEALKANLSREIKR